MIHLIQLNIGETPESQVWINHPGERIINGNGRPSYFAGNGCRPKIKQNRSKATLEFDILEVHDVDFTHAYTPLEHFEEYIMQDKWLFLKKLDGYIGLHVENGYELTNSGPLKNREIKSYGKKNKWTAKVGSKHEFGSFEGFVQEHING